MEQIMSLEKFFSSLIRISANTQHSQLIKCKAPMEIGTASIVVKIIYELIVFCKLCDRNQKCIISYQCCYMLLTTSLLIALTGVWWCWNKGPLDNSISTFTPRSCAMSGWRPSVQTGSPCSPCQPLKSTTFRNDWCTGTGLGFLPQCSKNF